MHLACSHVMIQNNHTNLMIQNKHTNLTSKTILQILPSQNNYTNLTPHHPPNMLCNILLILDIVSIHPQIHILFILAIVSIHQQLLLYITPSYMTLHLGIYHVEIILLQSTRYPHTYDLKVIQISDLIIIIIIIIISSRKKMKTQS
jgi:hypothetical protein